MLYLLAIFLPPVAVLMCGKPFQAVANIFLTLAFWLPGTIHALFVVNGRHADKRIDQLAKAMGQNRR